LQILNERNRKVLYAVIQSYIDYPGPVGSRAITKRYPFGLSPATIRNIMADLEEMGFLAQPHTSAGRVPTDLGYRFYVDTLISEGGEYRNREILEGLYRKFEALRNDIDVLFTETTKSLSLLSHYLGIAMSPVPDMTTLRRINLLKYKGDRAVVVLFTDEGMLKNKVVSIDPDISQKDLNRIASYLNSEFSGSTFDEIRTRVIQEMSQEKHTCEALISQAMKICQDALHFHDSSVFVSGLAEVLNLPDFADLKKIRSLSRAIEDKHTIIQLLDNLSDAEGVHVIIGSENSTNEMQKLSVVVSPCREGSRSVGVVGIIGPTRMNYAKAMYIVENTSRLISRILSER
jgi:heat-inducible transcriptional repressor